ncbi:MAG: esterase [Lachnospiraceae bacterium]|nr:esterase [Lachnospiraceae bacterium]
MREYLEFGDPKSDLLLLQPVDSADLSGMEREIGRVRELTKVPFGLLAIPVQNWNDDLSPWEAPAVFGDRGFGGGARDTLEGILEICDGLQGEGKRQFVLGGYSLAGLFALWAGCHTGRFRGIAAASPSVWFPGFPDHLREHGINCDAAYLSLGDREEKTKHPVMSRVGACIRETEEILLEQGIPCTLEWNPGNHFRDADLRTAAAFAWVLEHLRDPMVISSEI